jgi:hypothetical protein
MSTTLCQMVKGAHDWTTQEKNSMRRLFEHILKVWPNLVVCLRETQGTLVLKAEERGDYNWRSIADLDLELIRLSDAGQQETAITKIEERLHREVMDFWPDCPLESWRQFLTERLARHSQ